MGSKKLSDGIYPPEEEYIKCGGVELVLLDEDDTEAIKDIIDEFALEDEQPFIKTVKSRTFRQAAARPGAPQT